MLNNFSPERIFKNLLKWFSWIILIMAIAAIILMSVVESVDIDIFSRSFTYFASLGGLCSIIIYFSFSTDGQNKGKETEAYLSNYRLYRSKITGRQRKEVSEFLQHMREDERQAFRLKVCGMVGITEKELSCMTLGAVKRNSDFTRHQKRLLRKVLKNNYPDTIPKTPNELLNVIANPLQKQKALNTEAKRKYLFIKGLFKILGTTGFLFLGAGIIITGGMENLIQSIIKIIFVVLSFFTTLYNGYKDGYTATAEIEKDTLGAAISMLNDMDVWLKNRQPAAEPKPEIPSEINQKSNENAE